MLVKDLNVQPVRPPVAVGSTTGRIAMRNRTFARAVGFLVHNVLLDYLEFSAV
jgi:hypothetical protein